MKNKNSYLLSLCLFGLMLMSSACPNENKKLESSKKAKIQSMYDLTRPKKQLVLSKKLLEISGLTYIGNGQLAAVNDEQAWVYLIDGETGKIFDKIDFGKKGDYEGITVMENKMYVISSKGDVYKLKNYKNSEKTKKYTTKLSLKNDVEGLCYLEKESALLLACKEQTGYKKHEKDWRYIYKFDLEEKELSEEIFLKISEKEIGDFLGEDMSEKFKPSGIAISPYDNNIFIISSVGRALAIYSEKRKLLAVLRLSRDLFSQPEGITFDEKGNLYISNEGRKGRGDILIFERKSF